MHSGKRRLRSVWITARLQRIVTFGVRTDPIFREYDWTGNNPAVGNAQYKSLSSDQLTSSPASRNNVPVATAAALNQRQARWLLG